MVSIKHQMNTMTWAANWWSVCQFSRIWRDAATFSLTIVHFFNDCFEKWCELTMTAHNLHLYCGYRFIFVVERKRANESNSFIMSNDDTPFVLIIEHKCKFDHFSCNRWVTSIAEHKCNTLNSTQRMCNFECQH